MHKVIVKTYFYSEYEINFLLMNLAESRGIVDEFLLYEFSHTHSGVKREQVFTKIRERIPAEDLPRIKYKLIDISNDVIKTSHLMSKRQQAKSLEKVMRQMAFKSEDISERDLIFSLDADEVLYRKTYKAISRINSLALGRIHFCFKLHQLMYRPNIIWRNANFIAPVAATCKMIGNLESNWRYSGIKYPSVAGCHFSWNLPISEMVYKSKVYSHAMDFRQFKDNVFFEDAIKNLSYPFDLSREVKMDKMSDIEAKRILPRSFFNFDWSHLDVNI